MKAKLHNAVSHAYTPEHLILPDANVWLYLYAPVSGPAPKPDEAAYSKAFKTICEVGCRVLLHPLVLGEYLNRYCHLEWKLSYPNQKLDKRARQGSDFRAIAQDASASAQQILKKASLIPMPLAECPATVLLPRFATGGLDWNDLLIAECCLQNNYWLLTHDADFKDAGIPVLTTNARLLAST